LKQHFIFLEPPGGLLTKDVLAGTPTEPFLGVVHLARSIVSRTGERVLALRTVLVLIVLLVRRLPRGTNSVHVISHPVKSMSLGPCLRVRHVSWQSLSFIGSRDGGIRESETTSFVSVISSLSS